MTTKTDCTMKLYVIRHSYYSREVIEIIIAESYEKALEIGKIDWVRVNGCKVYNIDEGLKCSVEVDYVYGWGE